MASHYQATPKLWTELENSLQLDLPVTTQLIELLQLERSSLEERDYDQFQQVISKKHPLLKQLEVHSQSRQRLLQQAGFTGEQETLEVAQQQVPALATIWQQLAKQWQQCQELNEINERIAQRTRLVVGQILDLLRGQHHEAKLYTNRGDARRGNDSRPITSA